MPAQTIAANAAQLVSELGQLSTHVDFLCLLSEEDRNGIVQEFQERGGILLVRHHTWIKILFQVGAFAQNGGYVTIRDRKRNRG